MPNPMLLPNVVSNILQNISDSSTLEKLRLVSHCWNLEACLLLRHHRTIEFQTIQSICSYKELFSQTYEILGVFPHSKYRFAFQNFQNQLLIFNSVNDEDRLKAFEKVIEEFLEIFGEKITFCHVPVQSRYFEIHFLDLVISRLPNLSNLSLHIQYYQKLLPIELSPHTIRHLNAVHSLSIQMEGFEISEDATVELLSMLFLYMPNLKRISYPGDIRRISKAGLLLRDIILDSQTSSMLTKLGFLEFKMRLLEEHCLKLLCTNLPIKALYVDLYNPDDDNDCVSSDILAGLFQNWKNTIQHLEVEFPFRKEVSFHFNFPLPMENLRVLYLGGFEGCLLELLKKLPKVYKLDLSQLDLMSILPKPEETDVFSSVKQLRLDFCTSQTAGVLSRFSRIFPLLQDLNVNHTTNEVLRMIFQKMRQLSKLRVQGDDITDAGMCGFSEYATKENDFMSISSQNGKKYRKYAYIADLTNLQYLKLDAYSLTEVTVRHGLVHCRSLRLVKMDCTTGGSDPSTTVSRRFKLSEYENHLVEDANTATVEMKEEPPMEQEALEFFQSYNKYSQDLV